MTLFKQLDIRRIHVFIALAVFLILWRIPYYGKVALDDPFITFRYADNLVKHGQLVFNLGEYVLATTTPVYTLLMAAVDVIGLPIPAVATILNLGFESGLLYVLGLIIAEFKLSRWPEYRAYGLAGVLIITNRAMSVASQCGMETPLFVLLNLLTVYYTMRRAYIPAAVAGSLAILTRPDGIFALLVLGTYVLVREKRLPLREMAISVLIGLPWIIVALLTYGSFIPHSVAAKDAVAPIWFVTPRLKLQILVYDPLRWFFVFTLPPILWAGWRLFRPPYRVKGWPLLAFAGLHVVYILLPGNLGFDWYFAPIFTMLDLFTGLGLALALSEFASPDRRRYRFIAHNAARVCGAALVVAVGYTSLDNYQTLARMDRILREGQIPAIDFVKRTAAPGSTIQTDSIGMLGYDTGYRILDAAGLASPEVLPLMSCVSDIAQLFAAVAAQFSPDYILSNTPANYVGYDKLAEFPTVGITYTVYRRSDKPGAGDR